jgi:hypothetical protein
MELVAEPETEPQSTQAPKPVKPLPEAKAELASALQKFEAQKLEIEENQSRLSEAQKDEQDLLAADELDEEQQVAKLSTVVAKQRLLTSKIDKARGQLESSEGELRQLVEVAHRSFGGALSDLLKDRTAKHLARLNEMLEPAQRVWAEGAAIQFIQHTPDLRLLNTLGDHTGAILRSGAPRKIAESLLMDIAKLEAEKAGER